MTGSIGAIGHRIYAPEFKMTILNYLEIHFHSETARYFAVFPSTTIGNWLSAYRKFGDNGLKPKPKGGLNSLKRYASFHDFKVVVDPFTNYYNNHRIKQKLNGLSPIRYLQLTTESVS